MLEDNKARLAGNACLLGNKVGISRSAHGHMNLRRQRKCVALGRIVHANGPAAGLRGAEVDSGSGRGVTGFAIEDQIAGFEVDGILQLLWSRLIGRGPAPGVGFEINLHVAPRGDVSGIWIVGEIVAVNLIEARGIAAVENNADIVQFGVAIELELFNIFSVYGKNRATALGFGN